jgi:hypothetical protein
VNISVLEAGIDRWVVFWIDETNTKPVRSLSGSRSENWIQGDKNRSKSRGKDWYDNRSVSWSQSGVWDKSLSKGKTAKR